MAMRVGTLSDEEMGWFIRERDRDRDGAGLGALATERGNLPLERLDLRAVVTGLSARTELSQGFHNPYDVPLEATYIFPLPDRAAVTALRMEAADRVVDGELKERERARADYDAAVASGRRASIAEQERPDVFTMRVGNILPGERVTVRLTLDGPLPYDSGQATYRFPLVVAPRYVPGQALGGEPVGDGVVLDTDAVPDASRITPPVLLPGFPSPVRLSIQVDVDPAGLPLAGARTSLYAARSEELPGGGSRLTVEPGERADRDFVLRLDYGDREAVTTALTLVPDAPHEGGDGTFRLTVLPPVTAAPARPRDVVLLLDRSGSMGGWKMVAARRAAARIVDTLTAADRFALLLFDHDVERPEGLPAGLVPATDRHRFRAVERLARVPARGGTEMLAPLTEAGTLLTAGTAGDEAGDAGPAGGGRGGVDRDRVLVLVTDGQVGNEDQIVQAMAGSLDRVRVHAVGIDRAVNAGFLGRLASLGGGRCELVESEDRLDEAMARIHRRIGTAVVTAPRLTTGTGLELLPDSITPARLPDLFEGAPLVVAGRYRGTAGPVTVTGTDPEGDPWTTTVQATTVRATTDRATTDRATTDPAKVDPVVVGWARAHLADLEDRYAAGTRDAVALERRMLEISLAYRVLCRFTAFVAVDSRVVTDGGTPHRVTQPVEQPSGWEMPAPQAVPAPGGGYGAAGGIVPMAFGAARRSMRAASDLDTSLSVPPMQPPPAAPRAPGVEAGRPSAPTPARGAHPGTAPAGGAQPGNPPAGGVQPGNAPAGGTRPGGIRAGGPSGPGGPRVGGGPGRSGVPWVPGGLDPVAMLRGQLAGELRRIEEFDAPVPGGSLPGGPAAGGSVARRLVVLADLGSRLDAMAGHLASQGVPAAAGGPVAVLRELAERLRACDGDNPPRGADLDRLWQETVDVLSRLVAGGPTGGSTGGEPAGGAGDAGGRGVKRDRRAFWKKG